MTKDSDNLLQRTIYIWQPYNQKPLTSGDAREIVANMQEFVRVLLEIYEKIEKEEKKS